MNDPDSDAPVQGMHGVIREYACLAPAANAVLYITPTENWAAAFPCQAALRVHINALT